MTELTDPELEAIIAGAIGTVDDSWADRDIEASFAEFDAPRIDPHRNGNAATPEPDTAGPAVALSIVPLADFAAVDEPTAQTLLGDGVVAAGGTLLLYGEAGSGKTSMGVDAAFHLAAGVPWLGLTVAKKAHVLLVENEGPRGPFRLKIRQKLDAWDGPPVDDRISVLDDPWGRIDLRSATIRELLAAWITEHATDVVMLGPLNKSGTEGPGTLDEVNAFEALRGEITDHVGRPLAWWLTHHTNRGGRVSGAWEPMPDTLIRIRAEGRDRSVLKFEKARWAPAHHGVRLTLAWQPGETYEVVERSDQVDQTPKVAPETYDQRVLDWLAAHPWATTDDLDNDVEGRATEVRAARKRLTEAGHLSSAPSRKLGLPGKGIRWNLSSHAAQNPVPGLGTPTDEKPSEPAQNGQPRPPSRPLKTGDGGTGFPDGPDQDEIERLADAARETERNA